MTARLVALLAALAVVASACAGGERLRLEAAFDDVIDLTVDSPVFASDVHIGSVRSIALTEDNRARVVMEVEADTGLPAEVEAILMQTSILGERGVELRPVSSGGRLASGVVQRTRVRSDLENLVVAGTDVLSFVAADRVSAVVHAGAVAFGGRGDVLGGLVDDIEVFVGEAEAGEDEIVRLLVNLDALLGTLGSEAETNAEAVEALARASRALAEEDERLLDALADLRELGDVGERILRENRRQLDDFFRQLRTIIAALTAIDGALNGLLVELPRHNLHVPNANLLEFVQIWQDSIMCGTDTEDRDNPAKSCDPPNPGRSNEEPDFFRSDECDEHGENCEHGHRTRNEPTDFGDEDDVEEEDDDSGGGGGG
ncbi:MAG: MCE family protein [Nitriliruptorales bacterium]